MLTLVYSDEDDCYDKTAVSHTVRSSDATLDAVSVRTPTSTLLASGTDETQSRDTAVSTNHVASSSLDDDEATTRPVAGGRCGLPFISRADVESVGPPWLQDSRGTSLQSDGLPSLQYGASSLLALVYERQSNSSQSPATAGDIAERTAVSQNASASTSLSPWLSSGMTVAAPVEVNIHQIDKMPITCVSVVDNHRTELSSDSIDEPLPLYSHRPNYTTNRARDSLESFSGCTSGVAVEEDSVNGVALLPDGGVDAQRVERPSFPRDDHSNELLIRTSTPIMHVEDYLLPDTDYTRPGRTNGSTDVDDDEVLRRNEVARDATSADVSKASERLCATRGSDACQTVDVSRSNDDRLPVEVVTSPDVAQDDVRLNETSTSSEHAHEVDRRWICVNGHLPLTAGDVHDACRVGRGSSPDAMCNVNASLASPTSAITASGRDVTDDGDLDETELRDEEECRRVAEQMSAAWSSTGGRIDVLNNDHNQFDSYLDPPTSPTLTAPHTHVRTPPAQLIDKSLIVIHQ